MPIVLKNEVVQIVRPGKVTQAREKVSAGAGDRGVQSQDCSRLSSLHQTHKFLLRFATEDKGEIVSTRNEVLGNVRALYVETDPLRPRVSVLGDTVACLTFCVRGVSHCWDLEPIRSPGSQGVVQLEVLIGLERKLIQRVVAHSYADGDLWAGFLILH